MFLVDFSCSASDSGFDHGNQILLKTLSIMVVFDIWRFFPTLRMRNEIQLQKTADVYVARSAQNKV